MDSGRHFTGVTPASGRDPRAWAHSHPSRDADAALGRVLGCGEGLSRIWCARSRHGLLVSGFVQQFLAWECCLLPLEPFAPGIPGANEVIGSGWVLDAVLPEQPPPRARCPASVIQDLRRPTSCLRARICGRTRSRVSRISTFCDPVGHEAQICDTSGKRDTIYRLLWRGLRRGLLVQTPVGTPQQSPLSKPGGLRRAQPRLNFGGLVRPERRDTPGRGGRCD